MKYYRAEIEGHHFEVRCGDLGGQHVLIDGRIVSRKPLAGWLPSHPHRFEMTDRTGKACLIEVRVDTPSMGIGQTHVVVSLDGAQRCRLSPVDARQPSTRCSNCGYELTHLPTTNGEVRCPECGRHTSAKLLGRRD